MKIFHRILITFPIALFGFVSMAYFAWHKPKSDSKNNLHSIDHNTLAISEFEKLKITAASLKIFGNKMNYNTTTCFLVDMGISSGKKRFFIYNLQNDSIEQAGLVTHGNGSEAGNGKLHFSNALSSNCTSLGKYRIAGEYIGKFGLAYKLYGLDETNNNAYSRNVVLHSHSCVPDDEVYPLSICKSLGCPTVSPAFLVILKSYITRSKKHIMMQIIN